MFLPFMKGNGDIMIWVLFTKKSERGFNSPMKDIEGEEIYSLVKPERSKLFSQHLERFPDF